MNTEQLSPVWSSETSTRQRLLMTDSSLSLNPRAASINRKLCRTARSGPLTQQAILDPIRHNRRFGIMAEVGRQHRQIGGDVGSLALSVDKGADDEGVP